jgi:hypothetical protein
MLIDGNISKQTHHMITTEFIILMIPDIYHVIDLVPSVPQLLLSYNRFFVIQLNFISIILLILDVYMQQNRSIKFLLTKLLYPNQ